MENSNQTMLASQNSEDVIDLLEVFFMLLSHWKSIIFAMLIGAVVAGGYYLLNVSPVYQADVEIYVATSEEMSSYSDVQVSSLLTDDYKQIIKSRNVLNKVIENLSLDISYRSLANMISIQNLENTRCIRIMVTCSEPMLARDIANELLVVSADQISKVISSVNTTIVDRADISSVAEIKPSFMKYLAMGAVGFAVILCGIYVLLLLLNTTMKTEDDINKYLGLTVLSAVPYYKEGR